jgi:hypothetical protein
VRHDDQYAGERVDGFLHLLDEHGSQVVGRLVEEQGVSRLGEQTGQGEPAALPCGQGAFGHEQIGRPEEPERNSCSVCSSMSPDRPAANALSSDRLGWCAGISCAR